MRRADSSSRRAFIALTGSVANATHPPAVAEPPASEAKTPCFASVADFLSASPKDCPLSWNGVTLYGVIDVGAGYETHGAPFNGNYPNGVATLIAKNSNGPRYTLVPNGLGQTYVGLKGAEPIASGWSFVFNLQNGFDPFTLQRANGPKSLIENNTIPLDAQTQTATRAGPASSSTQRPTPASVTRPTEH